MKILYFGTPMIAVAPLELLLQDSSVEVSAVVTQPDKPAGRGNKLHQPPVKIAALEADCDVIQPRRIRTGKFLQWCQEQNPDAIAVVAYGKILPKPLLDIPRLGCINLHYSLLPKYRGAAPVNWALVNGENKTGVSTMLMDEGLDTGPVLLQQEIAIHKTDTTPVLLEKLSKIGSPLLLKTLKKLQAGEIKPNPQDHSQASLAPLISKEDGIVNWSNPARNIENLWRGFQPWPGIQTTFRGGDFKLKRVSALEQKIEKPPGTIVVIDNKRLCAVCGDGHLLEIQQAQLPGKKALDSKDLINGLRIVEEDRFN